MLKKQTFLRHLLKQNYQLRRCVMGFSNPERENNQFLILENLCTPLSRISYQKQLEMKSRAVKDVIKKLKQKTAILRQNNFKILPISPSPVTEQYRNKDEINVLKGIDGDEKTFGFFTGKLNSEHEIFAIRPYKLIIMKDEHKRVLQVFENFVKQSPFPPCYRLDDGGYWRRLVLRSNLKGEVMAVAVCHPSDRTVEGIEEERKLLAQFFIENDVHLHSLYHQLCTHVKCTKENSDLALIHGEPYLYEEFMGYQFRISPDSFFQINIKGAEVLHEELLKLAEPRKTETLLDICCGVGTFSISFSKFVRNSVGIDISRSSIEDALTNIKLNEVNNCSFSVGEVETRLTSIFQQLDYTAHITAIVNPGRNGLHPRVIDLLRKHPSITKILYISCDPANINSLENFASLLKPAQKNIEKAFKLTAVKAIDLFPHTWHYELILKFER